MELGHIWRGFLVKWPASLPHTGVVIASFGEQIGFVNFMLSEHAALFERLAPDAMGGRKVILPYSQIQGIKITEPVGNEVFASLFRENPSKAAAG